MNWKFWKTEESGTGHPAFGRRIQMIEKARAPKQTPLPGLPGEEAREASYLKAPDNDLFLAVLADLQEFAVEVSDRGLDMNLTNDQLRWHMGGSDALLEFLEKLQARERDARLTQAQIEAKKAEEQPADDAD